MTVQQENDEKEGRFFIEQEGKILAEMTYVWAGIDRIIISHTGVDEILKGRGAGNMMVNKAVEFAREKSIKIIPLCTFAKSVFDKTPEFKDVL